MVELYLVWKPKIVSWIILSPTLEPIKVHEDMSNIKGQKLTRCMPSKCKPKPFQANTNWSYGSSLPSASPSHFKQRPFHHNQGSSTPSLKWTKKKQVAQLCLTQHLVCNIMVKLKFCLFIPYFYISLNSKNPCTIWCTLFMYIFF